MSMGPKPPGSPLSGRRVCGAGPAGPRRDKGAVRFHKGQGRRWPDLAYIRGLGYGRCPGPVDGRRFNKTGWPIGRTTASRSISTPLAPSDQIWKMSAAGGPARQITKRGGRLAMQSPDGLYYYSTQTYHDLWRVPVEGGEETLVRSGVGAFHFKPAPGGTYHISKNQETGGQAIQFLAFATQRDTVILSIPDQLIGPALEVSSDGRTPSTPCRKSRKAI